jgi:hypothetical protein
VKQEKNDYFVLFLGSTEEDLKLKNERMIRSPKMTNFEEPSIYNNLEGLKDFLLENLKETRELKEMLSKNDKAFHSERKPDRKRNKEDNWNSIDKPKETGIKLEINEAERKVFEIQTQRLLNKVFFK